MHPRQGEGVSRGAEAGRHTESRGGGQGQTLTANLAPHCISASGLWQPLCGPKSGTVSPSILGEVSRGGAAGNVCGT